jgi:hypothetical protein
MSPSGGFASLTASQFEAGLLKGLRQSREVLASMSDSRYTVVVFLFFLFLFCFYLCVLCINHAFDYSMTGWCTVTPDETVRCKAGLFIHNRPPPCLCGS